MLTYMIKYITIKEYAKLKGITEWYARKLCRLGKVKAERFGGVWMIKKP